MSEAQKIDLDVGKSIQQDWLAVKNSLLRAMQEIALELGGEEFAEKVAQAAVSDGALPNSGAFVLLEDLRPGSTELAITRMTEIEEAARERELEEIRKFSAVKYGKAILKGFASFNIFGGSSRKS